MHKPAQLLASHCFAAFLSVAGQAVAGPNRPVFEVTAIIEGPLI
jgi:hypothetical protein